MAKEYPAIPLEVEIAGGSPARGDNKFVYDAKTRARFQLPVKNEHYPNSEYDAIVVQACSDEGYLVEDVVAEAQSAKKESRLVLDKENIMYSRRNTLIKGKSFFGMGLTPGGDKTITILECIKIPTVTTDEDGIKFWSKYFFRGFWSDFAYYIKNNHPLCVLFLSAKEHPFTKKYVYLLSDIFFRSFL